VGEKTRGKKVIETAGAPTGSPALACVPTTAIVHIDGELTIYRAAELKELLMAPIQRGEAVEIDLHEVTEIDSAGVQLLLLAGRSLSALGHTLRLARVSQVVADTLTLLELNHHFDQPVAA
jgi:anti-anti-sigma factor